MTAFICKPGGSVSGKIRVPGDKSISHRSVMLASIAEGVSHISGFLQGEDSLNTIAAFKQMGVQIERKLDRVTVSGVGLHGLQSAPQEKVSLRRKSAPLHLCHLMLQHNILII